MVNIGLNPGSLLGIVLALAGAALYLLRSQRPALARDHDIFFAAVALLSGGILFFQGWRLDPILQFLQFLLAGSAVFYAYDGIRLRGVATQQAKRNTPIVDDERRVSNAYSYQAEFEELNPYEERQPRRRIPGSREPRPSRDEYDEDNRSRRTSTRPSGEERSIPGDRSRRRPRPRPDRPIDYPNGADDNDFREERPSRSRSTSRADEPPVSSSRPRRSRPASDEPVSRRDRVTDADVPSSEYVDYRPIDEEDDNW